MKRMKSERGQSVLLFAILMPLMSLFLLGILDYMVTNARTMETVGIADLAAHAGAQEITVLPDGTITATSGGNQIAALYFNAQRPSYSTTDLRLVWSPPGTARLPGHCAGAFGRVSPAFPLGDRACHRVSGARRDPRRSIKLSTELYETILQYHSRWTDLPRPGRTQAAARLHRSWRWRSWSCWS